MGLHRGGRQQPRRVASPAADVAIAVLVLEAQDVAGLGLQQAADLLADERKEDLRVRLARDLGGDALQRRLLACQRLRPAGVAAQGLRAVDLLDRQAGEMHRAGDDEAVALVGRARRVVVDRERAEHGSAAREDRCRPAGPQTVARGEVDVPGAQLAGGDVVHDERLAAEGRSAADAAALGDGDAVERPRELPRHPVTCDDAQPVVAAANPLEAGDRRQHPGGVHLGGVEQNGQRAAQRRTRRDELEHHLLAVTPALLSFGLGPRGLNVELGHGR